jgi:hypothetical protein
MLRVQSRGMVQDPSSLWVATLGAPPDNALISWWLRQRKAVPKAHRKGFDSLVLLITWSLWLERNGRVFRGCSTVLVSLVEGVRGVDLAMKGLDLMCRRVTQRSILMH